MDVQLAVLADCANVALGQKLNIMGIFDTIEAADFPTLQPFMALAIRFRLDYEDGNRTHSIVISLRDEDQREYARAVSELPVGRIPPGEVAHTDRVLNFAGTVFSKPGRFAFHIICDDDHKARVELNIRRGPLPAP